jgi:hypothetical protein
MGDDAAQILPGNPPYRGQVQTLALSLTLSAFPSLTAVYHV